MRVKGGPKGPQRHKRLLRLAKGYYGQRSKIYRRAHESILHAGEYAFAGRKLRRRNFRTLWIQRVKAALTPFDLKYSLFIKLLADKKIELDRKILASLAVDDLTAFAKIVEKVKA